MKLQKFSDVFPNTAKVPDTKEAVTELAGKVSRGELESYKVELIQKIEGMKKEVSPEDEYASDYGTGKLYGWNNALEAVIDKVKGK